MGRTGTYKKQVSRPLTEEEEADEIIKRLQAPPKRRKNIEEEIMEAMMAEIVKEIDEEILNSLKVDIETVSLREVEKWQKQYLNTKIYWDKS